MGLLALTAAATLAAADPQPTPKQLSIPPPDSPRPVGSASTTAPFNALDPLVQRYGISKRFVRTVHHVDAAVSMIAPPHVKSSGQFAVVNYKLPRDGVLASGVQVWIDRKSGNWWVVPKSVIRAADRVVVRTGYDMTDYQRVIEKIHNFYYVAYNFETKGEGEGMVADGQFTVKVDVKTGKPLEALYHWDGAVEHPLER